MHPTTKKCKGKTCRKTKSLKEFHRNKNKALGRQDYCKDCCKLMKKHNYEDYYAKKDHNPGQMAGIDLSWMTGFHERF